MKNLEITSLWNCAEVWQISFSVILISQAELSWVFVNEEWYILNFMSSNWLRTRWIFNSKVNYFTTSKSGSHRWRIRLYFSLLIGFFLKINIIRSLCTYDLSVSSSFLADWACNLFSFFELSLISFTKIWLENSSKITETWIPHVSNGSIAWSLLLLCFSNFILFNRSRPSDGWIQESRNLISRFWRIVRLSIRTEINNRILNSLAIIIFLGTK